MKEVLRTNFLSSLVPDLRDRVSYITTGKGKMKFPLFKKQEKNANEGTKIQSFVLSSVVFPLICHGDFYFLCNIGLS